MRICIKIYLLIFISVLIAQDKIIINDGKYKATINRDNWGVPHVHGRSDGDAAFGLAYAHAQDDFRTIQDALVASRGMLGQLYGVKLKSIRGFFDLLKGKVTGVKGIENVANDYYVHVIGIWDGLDKKYINEVPADVRDVCDGYAAGINLYVKDNPKAAYKKLYPLQGIDVVAGFMHRTPLFYGIGGVFRKLMRAAAEPPTLIGLGPDEEKDPMQMLASNVIAVAPKRSADGYTRLMVNSHQPWSGPVAWYEAHISSDDGWDMITGLFPGSPVGLVGHNPDLGWSHTVNDPDLIDVYRLTINPDNEDQYWYDGNWRDLEVKKTKIKVKILGPLSWPVKRDLYRSIMDRS